MPPQVQRSVFYGFGAWVGQQTGPTSCKWWAQDPNTLNPPFDSSKYITNNLAKNPFAVNNGEPIANLQVDNAPVNGGLTKIGATFPGGSLINGCWLDKLIWDGMAAGIKPLHPPADMECRAYELETVYYWPNTGNPLATRRFWGFYAHIDSENGQNALVSIWPAGKSLERNIQPVGAWWLNLSNVAHPIETGFTFIGVGLHPKQGALFLDAVTVASLGVNGPKLPKFTGHESYPLSRSS